MANIFKLNEANQIEIVEEAKFLCPILSFLSNRDLKYIIMVYDYINGPFSRKPESERVELALQILYPNEDVSREDIEENNVIKKGIELYKSLIYDNIRYTLDAFKEKKFFVMRQMADADPKDIKQIKNIGSTLEYLTNQIKLFEKSIEEEETVLRIKGRKKESLIERLKRNKELYNLQNKKYHGSKIQNKF